MLSLSPSLFHKHTLFSLSLSLQCVRACEVCIPGPCSKIIWSVGESLFSSERQGCHLKTHFREYGEINRQKLLAFSKLLLCLNKNRAQWLVQNLKDCWIPKIVVCIVKMINFYCDSRCWKVITQTICHFEASIKWKIQKGKKINFQKNCAVSSFLLQQISFRHYTKKKLI